MFTRKPPEPTALDDVIASVLTDLNSVTSDSEEYDKMADQLVKLMKLKNDIHPSTRVSPDTLAIIAANLAGILLIIGYERANVISSKALSFIAKLR